jgi:hypothetical protein
VVRQGKTKIHRRMLSQYGENCITPMKVYQWVEGVKVVDKVSLMKTNWAVLAQTVDSVEPASVLVQEDRLLSLIWPQSWTSAVDPHITSSMTTLSIRNLCKDRQTTVIDMAT